MSRIRPFVAKFIALFRRRADDEELSREVAAHLALLEDEYRRRGFAPDQARRAARLAIGGPEQTKALHRDARSFLWMDDLLRDVRYGLRTLVRQPGFTLAAIAVLAVGVGLNLAFFHAIKASLSQRIPVPDGDTLVRIVRQSPERERWGFTMETLDFYRAYSDRFAYFVAERLGAIPVQLETDEEDARAKFVSGNYFDALRVTPLVGRLFGPQDDRPGAPLVALLSQGYWQRRFGGDPGVVSTTVTVNGNAVLVAGVIPSEFTGVAMSRGDLWLPDAARLQLLKIGDRARSDSPDYAIVGLPRTGVSLDAASAQIAGLTSELRVRQPGLLDDRDVLRMRGVGEDERRGNGSVIGTALVLLVLLTSCANLGNMLLARGVARQREIEARIAVGASRGRLVRQLMTESLLLSGLGALAGLVVARVGAPVIVATIVQQPNVRITTDWTIVAATGVLALVCALVFGFAPARLLSRRRPRATRSRQTLVAVQVAASCVLLILAGLLTRGAQRQLELAGRADYSSIMVVEPELDDQKLASAAVLSTIEGMAERIGALPEVAAIAIGTDPIYNVSILSTADIPVILQARVDSRYFQVMQIRLLRGRTFEPGERNVAVISRDAARAAFDDEDDALGRLWNPTGDAGSTVIGIVEDSPVARLRDVRAVESYLPLTEEVVSNASIIVRTHGDARGVTRRARSAASIPGVTPTAWLLQRPLDQLLQHSIGAARLIAVFGGIASALAAFGIFGLLAFAVRERTRELAIRRALGARLGSLARLLVSQYVTALGLGIAAGIVAATLAARAMIGVSAGLGLDTSLDPSGYALGLAVFTLTALAAVLPAVRRAARVDAAAALRAE
jgi:predicted permease